MSKILMIIAVFGCCFLFDNPASGYKILMVCPLPARSHNNLCRGVTDILSERGHEVTHITAYASTNKKIKEIAIPELERTKEKFDMGFELSKKPMLSTLKTLNTMQEEMMKAIFGNKQFLNFFNDKSEKFDLIIVEYFFNIYNLGFSVKYNCPTVLLSPVGLMSALAGMTSNPYSIAIVPDVMTAFPIKMSFKERLFNTFSVLMQELSGRFYFEPFQESMYKQYFPDEHKKVPYSELKKLVSSVLVNTHPSAGVSRPLLPNAVEIGGYHIEEPGPLPEDLKKVIDSAKHGVVFFSMGSNLKSSQMKPELRRSIIKALSSIKETVLWKFEEDLPEKPSNVIIKSWMPQTGVLAHPNVKLFISHGGLLSTTESIYFGVPQLAIPIFGDQYYNARAASDRGHAMTLAFDNITETSFKWALQEMLSNPKYGINAKKVQEIFHDRPIKPRDLLAFHVEHVIRTKGAPHLSPPSLSLCSHLLLDVAAVILLPLGAIIILIFIMCRKCCCRKNNKEAVQNKKNKQQ